jgi:hypothetical protein
MTISTRCRTLAEQAKVSAKSMHCRANADARAAALKAASVYVMAAGWSETMDMAALAERCREQGNAYLASAKPYKAGPKRSAYIRGAAALFEVARWADEEATQEGLHEAIHAQAMAQGAGTPDPDGQAMETAEGTDTPEGQVPVPALPTRRPRARGNRGGPQDPAVQGRNGQAGEPTEPVQ